MKEIIQFESITEESMPDAIKVLAEGRAYLKFLDLEGINQEKLEKLLNSLNGKGLYMLPIVFSRELLNAANIETTAMRFLKQVKVAFFKHIKVDYHIFPMCEIEPGKYIELSELEGFEHYWATYVSMRKKYWHLHNAERINAHLEHIQGEAMNMHKAAPQQMAKVFAPVEHREFEVYKGDSLLENKELAGEVNLKYEIKSFSPRAYNELAPRSIGLAPRCTAFNISNPLLGFVVKKHPKECTLVLDYDERAIRDTNIFTINPAHEIVYNTLLYKGLQYDSMPDNFNNLYARFGKAGVSLLEDYQNKFGDVFTAYVNKLSQVDILLENANFLYCLHQIRNYAGYKRECLINFLNLTSKPTSHLIDILAAFEVFWGEYIRLCLKYEIREIDKVNNLIAIDSDGNPIVCMERLLTILINAGDALNLQLCAEGVKLNYFGVYYASKYEGKKVVSGKTLPSMLSEAASKGDEKAIISLFNRGANPKETDENGVPPVKYAITSPNVQAGSACIFNKEMRLYRYWLLKEANLFPPEVVQFIINFYQPLVTRSYVYCIRELAIKGAVFPDLKSVVTWSIESRNREIVETCVRESRGGGSAVSVVIFEQEVLASLKHNDLNLTLLWIIAYAYNNRSHRMVVDLIYEICLELKPYPLMWQFLNMLEVVYKELPSRAHFIKKLLKDIPNDSVRWEEDVRWFLEKSTEINNEQLHVGFALLKNIMCSSFSRIGIGCNNIYTFTPINKINFLLNNGVDLKDKAYDKLLKSVCEHYEKHIDKYMSLSSYEIIKHAMKPLIDRGLDFAKQVENCTGSHEGHFIALDTLSKNCEEIKSQEKTRMIYLISGMAGFMGFCATTMLIPKIKTYITNPKALLGMCCLGGVICGKIAYSIAERYCNSKITTVKGEERVAGELLNR